MKYTTIDVIHTGCYFKEAAYIFKLLRNSVDNDYGVLYGDDQYVSGISIDDYIERNLKDRIDYSKTMDRTAVVRWVDNEVLLVLHPKNSPLSETLHWNMLKIKEVKTFFKDALKKLIVKMSSIKGLEEDDKFILLPCGEVDYNSVNEYCKDSKKYEGYESFLFEHVKPKDIRKNEALTIEKLKQAYKTFTEKEEFEVPEGKIADPFLTEGRKVALRKMTDVFEKCFKNELDKEISLFILQNGQPPVTFFCGKIYAMIARNEKQKLINYLMSEIEDNVYFVMHDFERKAVIEFIYNYFISESWSKVKDAVDDLRECEKSLGLPSVHVLLNQLYEYGTLLSAE